MLPHFPAWKMMQTHENGLRSLCYIEDGSAHEMRNEMHLSSEVALIPNCIL